MRFMTMLAGLMTIVIVVYCYKIYQKRRSRWRKRSTKKNDMVYKMISGRDYFDKLLTERYYNRHISDRVDIVNTFNEVVNKNERVIGGFVYMTKPLLQRNKQLQKDKIVVRNATLRRKSWVPGMKMVNKEHVIVGGDRQSLWHITHGAPFRYILSDGEIPNMMFMGTAHLNMGARYDRGYVPAVKGTIDSNSNRVKALKKQVDANKGNPEGLRLKFPLVPGIDRSVYGNVQYSMDDFERLGDYIINANPDNTFKYGFECYYRGNDIIPSHVRVIMINMDTHYVMFDVLLKNIK